MKRDDHFVCEAYVIGFCLEQDGHGSDISELQDSFANIIENALTPPYLPFNATSFIAIFVK